MTTWSEISVPTAPDEDEDDREMMLNRYEFQSRLNEFRDRAFGTGGELHHRGDELVHIH